MPVAGRHTIGHVGFAASPRAGARVHDFKLTRVDPAAPGEHPHMFVEKDDFSAIQDKASRSPWREIKAFAGRTYDTLEYAPEPDTHPKFRANRLANIFSQSALWYIL